jgi:hypothetical protein
VNPAIQTKRVFLSGQLVEYWENAELPFGWAHEDLQAYLDRGQWVLLFNAMALNAPRPGAGHGS